MKYVQNSDDVSERQPPTGILFICQMIFEYGEPQWNDIEGWDYSKHITVIPAL
jgi:hypothetical protein